MYFPNTIYTLYPLEIRNNALQESWSPVSHLNSVANSPKLREVYESCLSLLSEYSTFVGQHEALYNMSWWLRGLRRQSHI